MVTNQVGAMYSCGGTFSDGKDTRQPPHHIPATLHVPIFAKIQESTATVHHPGMNGRKYNKHIKNLRSSFSCERHQEDREGPCLVAGDQALQTRSDVAFAGGNFKVSVYNTANVLSVG